MSILEPRKVLLIQARNLGDAVISTALVETIARGLPGIRIDVLARPELSQIFIHSPYVDHVFTGRFPMSSLRDFGWQEALALLKMAIMLRGQGYTDVVNLQGDFREEFLGLFITHERNWSPAWAPGHPCSQIVREAVLRLANSRVPIPRDQPNVYSAAAIMGMAVTGSVARKPALYTPSKKEISWDPLAATVGIHPMASQPWRRWELEKWSIVAGRLIERGLDIHVFGSPSEAAELALHFGSLDPAKLSIVAGSLENYFTSVAKMRVLLCPDSFASHVAYALGVPIILLNGANDAEAWAPPGTEVLAAEPELPCYPCYNRPACFGTDHEYGCVRWIQIQSVLETVREVLQAQESSTS